MKIEDLLLESPVVSRFVMDLARRITHDLHRLLPTPTSYLEFDLSNYLGKNTPLSHLSVGVNKGTEWIDGVYDHAIDMIIVNGGWNDKGVSGMFEQILVHELSHVMDGDKSKMSAFKPNKVSYHHKATEVNSRFNELIYRLDKKFNGRPVTFDSYLKMAMSMLEQVKLQPTSFENIELYTPRHLRHLPVADTIPHLRPMKGIQQKTYKRIVNRLYANWKFQYDN